MKVTVLFLGICTHVVKRTADCEIENVRVVLPNASFGRYIDGQQIPPHSALIWIPKQFIAGIDGAMLGLQPAVGPSVWSMNGVSLDIPTPDQRALPAVNPSYNNLPSLSAVLKKNDIRFTHPLRIDHSVVDEGGAACVFTIEHGSLDALTSGVAVHGRVTIDGGAAPQLRVIRMWDRAATHITLRGPDPFIVIANAGTNDDKEIDFLLHYGVTTSSPRLSPTFKGLPAGIRKATEAEEFILESSPICSYTLTHGCSNSIYP